MTELWRRYLWAYRAAQVTPVRLKQALEDEVGRIETYYHQKLEAEENILSGIAPRLIDRFQDSTRRVLEGLSHSAFFAAARDLERAQVHLKELEEVLQIQRFHETVSARCCEVHDELESEQLRRLRTGEMLKRLPETGRDFLVAGDYLAARFIARSCYLLVKRLTASSQEPAKKRLLEVRLGALSSAEIETEVYEVLRVFLEQDRLYLAAQIIGDLEVWAARDRKDSDLQATLLRLRSTGDRARQVAETIHSDFLPQSSIEPKEAPGG